MNVLADADTSRWGVRWEMLVAGLGRITKPGTAMANGSPAFGHFQRRTFEPETMSSLSRRLKQTGAATIGLMLQLFVRSCYLRHAMPNENFTMGTSSEVSGAAARSAGGGELRGRLGAGLPKNWSCRRVAFGPKLACMPQRLRPDLVPHAKQ